MNQTYQLREITNQLNDLEKEYNNVNKMGEVLYEYLYNNLNLTDSFLATLLLDGEAFNRKGCTGYINYLATFLTIIDDSSLTYKVWNFVTYVKMNNKRKSLKTIAKNF